MCAIQLVHGVFSQLTTDASLFVDWNTVPIAGGDSGGMQLQDVFRRSSVARTIDLRWSLRSAVRFVLI